MVATHNITSLFYPYQEFFRRYMLDNLFTRYLVTGENVMISLSRVYDRHLQHCRIILDHSERGHLLEQASLNSNAIWKILNCCLPRQNSFKKRVSFNERFVVAVCFKVNSVKSIVSEANQLQNSEGRLSLACIERNK